LTYNRKRVAAESCASGQDGDLGDARLRNGCWQQAGYEKAGAAESQ
jgi:hypothetical protein